MGACLNYRRNFKNKIIIALDSKKSFDFDRVLHVQFNNSIIYCKTCFSNHLLGSIKKSLVLFHLNFFSLAVDFK
jgi:hypothetical protein